MRTGVAIGGLIVVLLALVACDMPLPAPTPIPTPPPTLTVESAPAFGTIRAAIAGIWNGGRAVPTPASIATAAVYQQQFQRDIANLNATLRGKMVADWQGWVVQVRPEQDGEYLVAVDMDELDAPGPFLGFAYFGVRRVGLADVLLTNIAAAEGSKLRVGQRVRLSGRLADLDQWMDYSLPLDPANARLAVMIEQGSVRPVAPDAKPDAIDPRNVTIALSRPVCSQGMTRCYTYDLVVHGDGSVFYREENWSWTAAAPAVITDTYQISPASVSALVADFKSINYFALDDDYDSFDITDYGSATTSITSGNWRKSIYHYKGDLGAPAALTALELKIDQLANLKRPTPPTAP